LGKNSGMPGIVAGSMRPDGLCKVRGPGCLCGDSMAALPGLPKVEELIHDQDCDQ
jgi:hypothetical protein